MDTHGEARSPSDTEHERHGTEPRTIAGARLEIAATRNRISGTVAELEQQMTERIDDVKQKVSVVALARRHPWAALTVAFVGGFALSAAGADRRAARAATRAARRAPELARRGATAAASATAAGAAHLVSAAVERVRGARDDRTAATDSGGLTARTIGELKTQVRELREEAERGVDDLTSS